MAPPAAREVGFLKARPSRGANRAHHRGPPSKGVASWHIQLEVGIGGHRAYDWNIEVGYKVVGL